jgi:hypothetical protein
MNEMEITHKLEKAFPFLTHIIFEGIEANGTYVFDCIDTEMDSKLKVDNEGWVSSRKYYSNFWDILGQIR